MLHSGVQGAGTIGHSSRRGEPPALSVVVPCFNEQEMLAETYARLSSLLLRLVSCGKIAARSEIVFVDDGSRDSTWLIIESLARSGERVVGVKLARNSGHQAALMAGLQAASGDASVTIDADLQDDENAIEAMVDAFRNGCEIVYGVRDRRDCDTWFKRTTARSFYRLMDLLGVRTVYDHADYRLMSRRAIAHLQQFGEANLFLRGVVPLLGLQSGVVRYDRRARMAGESKYPLRRMVEFALDGITSFSTRPLRLIAVVGFLLCLGCLGLGAWTLAVKLLSSHAVPGWASTLLPIYFLGGVQLLCIGVLGEYVGKIYIETKKRPRFLVEKVARERLGAGNTAHLARPARPRGFHARARLSQ